MTAKGAIAPTWHMATFGNPRREFLAAGAALAAAALGSSAASAQQAAAGTGSEHWVTKRTPQGDVRLFLWRRRAANASRGTILWVHGSSVQSQPSYDLQIPGKPEASVMGWFASLGYDNWCLDCEGYGRSDKRRPINADISTGADDVAAAVDYIYAQSNEKLLVYGSSSGALRASLFAQRHPEKVARLAVSGMVWTGEGSPTLAERRKRLPQYLASNRRPINREFVRSIFTRDRAGSSDPAEVESFADAVLALDDSMPTGTYVDMSANLPVVDPSKITVPVFILRGEWDGIATLQDLLNFYARLPNPDKQFSLLPGIAHSILRTKNWRMVYEQLDAYFGRANPVYLG
jgi:alpha-beta hydrolase superfamily lysophospholipase